MFNSNISVFVKLIQEYRGGAQFCLPKRLNVKNN